MQTSIKKILLFSLCSLLLLLAFPLNVKASENVSKYQALIVDDADLFSQAEEREILSMMEQSLTYGNMFLYTTNDNPYYDTYEMTDHMYLSIFGEEQGIAFVIDMQERMLWLSGEEDLDYILDDSYCEAITDNVYLYASTGDYANCALVAFSQVNDLLYGKYVPKTMKYISNLLLSVLIALIITFFIAMSSSKKSKPGTSAWARNMISKCDITNPRADFIKETKIYHSSSSSGGHHSSGGSHHSSGGSHHSSGGGHHSSGGGHRF